MTELSTQHQDLPSTETNLAPDTESVLDEMCALYPRIVAFLHMQGAQDDAEDIAQDTFIKAFAHLDTYEDRGKLGAWLKKIAMSILTDGRRRDKRRPLDFTDDAERLDRVAPDYETNPGTAVVLEDSRDRAFANIMANLTDDQATIFKLLIDGYSNTEISEILGVNRSTIGTRILRGRETLIRAGILPPE